ncbi:hypothetical protein [uncultured Clostridium sp.]|uniref:hypothetical protein n=1 Tax=uncultured Clostridium sp. TaxID=59620 RepID=UPI00261FFED8|nr:hypothetical protein [uncultured Clostridium sp.]
MSKHIMDVHYDDLMNLTELLKRLVDSYRLLIGGVAELNTVYHRKKSGVEDGLDRVEALGDIIDHVIKILDLHAEKYLEFIEVKGKTVSEKYEKKYMVTDINNMIQTEIQHELNFQNNPPNQRPTEE